MPAKKAAKPAKKASKETTGSKLKVKVKNLKSKKNAKGKVGLTCRCASCLCNP